MVKRGLFESTWGLVRVSENVRSLCERERGKFHTLPRVKHAGLNSYNVYVNHQKDKKGQATRES